MNLPAAQLISLPRGAGTELFSARVVSILDGRLEVTVADEILSAGISFSCLVRPEVGDLVLTVRLEDGRYVALAVVERPGSQQICLQFPADAALSAAGSLSLHAGEAVNLASNGRINCRADEFTHSSRTATLQMGQVRAQGDELIVAFSTLSFIGRTISTIAKQAVERFSCYIRRSRDYDQVQAGQMSRKSEGLYSLDTRVTIMNSKKDTKIDGERIFVA